MLVQEEHIKKLEREILAEQHARQQMEVRYAQDREEAETRINEAVHQMDQTSLNMQMAVAAKTAAEGKCAQLVDQKKLLVKEVKQQRKKIEEMTEQMNALRISYQQLQNQISIPPSPSRQSSSDGGVSRSGSMSLLRTIGGAALHHTSDDSDDEIDPNHGTQGSRSPSVASTTSHDNASGVPEHSPSNLLRTMFASIDHTHTTVKNNSNPLISPDDDMLRPSEESSQAHGIAEGDIGNANPNTMMYDGPDAFENEIAVVEDNSQKEQDKTEDSRAGKLICFRCDGTVEGPKYSTCKCAIPALNREQYEADMESEESAGKKVGNLFKSIGRRASFMAGLK